MIEGGYMGIGMSPPLTEQSYLVVVEVQNKFLTYHIDHSAKISINVKAHFYS